MSDYEMEVSVHFDMCSLEGHNWIKASNWGLAHLVEQKRCTKCGQTSIPYGEMIEIDRSQWQAWTNILYKSP